MFNLYTGLPGNGKTFFAVCYDLYPLLLSGIDVYSNTWINYNGKNLHYFTDPMEIVEKRNCAIFFDEIGIIMDSHNWSSLPSEVRYFLQEHRKRHCTIIATTQNISQMDKSARNIAGYWATVHNYTPTEGLKGRTGIGSWLPFLLFHEIPLDLNSVNSENPKPQELDFLDKLGNLRLFIKADMLHPKWDIHKLEPKSPLYDTDREIPRKVRSHYYKAYYGCPGCQKEHPYKGFRSDKELQLLNSLSEIIGADVTETQRLADCLLAEVEIFADPVAEADVSTSQSTDCGTVGFTPTS